MSNTYNKKGDKTMKSQSIRHYRVVQRKKEMNSNHPMNNMPALYEELKKLFCLGIIMYITSILFSFITGLMLGKKC